MKWGRGMRLAGVFLAILAWIGGVGSSPVFGHAHALSLDLHGHASSSLLIARDHAATDYDGPALEEFAFHLHTAWLGMPISLPAPSPLPGAGQAASDYSSNAFVAVASPVASADHACQAPFPAPLDCPWHPLLAPPDASRPSSSHARQGDPSPSGAGLRSVNLRC